MSNTKIRTSQQVYIDADLDHNGKKITNIADGSANTDGVSVGQMNAAMAGVGGAIHVPVADYVAMIAVNAAGRSDKMLMLVETLGLYRFDAESTAASNNAGLNTIIRPTDIASDVTAGRWLKMSSLLTDHALLDNILGNGGYHLSLAERDKLTGITAGADITNASTVGAAINGAAAATAMADADKVAIVTGGTLKNLSWAYVKSILVTYFNTLYNLYVHPNHTGDVTSVADGAQTIAANAVTNAKAAQMATHTIKGNNTAGTANAIDMTMAQLAVLLDDLTQWVSTAEIADKAVTAAKIADATITATQLAAKAVTLAKMDDMATASFIGRNTAATGVPEVLSISTVKTMLGLTPANQSTRYHRATPTGLVNGSNAVFTIAALVISGSEEVFKNGILMNAGAGNDYTIAYAATTTITFLTAPNSNGFTDVILVNYSV
ncbi:MAG: hypothetical protein ACOYOV_07555 [Bacteroidales bacterium]